VAKDEGAPDFILGSIKTLSNTPMAKVREKEDEKFDIMKLHITPDDFFNFKDEGGNIMYEVPIPGYVPNQLKLKMENGFAIIQGERTAIDGTDIMIYEQIPLNGSTDMRARFENGLIILTITKPDLKEIKIDEDKVGG